MSLNNRYDGFSWSKGFLYILLIVTVVFFLLPVYWVFIKAINGPIAIFKYPPDLFPKRFSLENFRNGFQNYDTMLGFFNTLKVVGINMTGTTIVSAIVAYGFARMDFPGRNVLFIIVIASILIPWDVKVIPQFMEFSYLGWTNTFFPLIVPMMFLAGALISFSTGTSCAHFSLRDLGNKKTNALQP